MVGLRKVAILFVEDDEEVAKAMARVLKAFQVGRAHTFEEAVEQMSPKIEVVISDYHLGAKRNGCDVLEEARKRLPGVPRILMTGEGGDEAEVAQAFSSGLADRVLLKPFSAATLLAVIRELLLPG